MIQITSARSVESRRQAKCIGMVTGWMTCLRDGSS
jgi:hypothetical protein